ncbi:triacylglycerol lipase [Lentithecium fluviatile CBS 122367]|uniref:Carboxylic ester hydrolase n=1 Tax=Lentithecium fluviatile CBS 122367 TaxID=1168545 RepID=A0A6G1J466_9PLEO|nr:triacylglycerol lipase [Lentithecium fluviatile CBS 122367]
MAFPTVRIGLLATILHVLASASPLKARQGAAPTAAVKNGTYNGIYSLEYDQDFFLGIPFAQPPVGELRFRNPVSLNTTWEGSADATRFSAACHNYGVLGTSAGTPFSEDCLTLNIVRPSGTDPSANLPVGVWIHGGAHIQGSNRDPMYNMSFIVQQSVAAGKPFIGININYRLQLFGFLYGSAVVESGVGNLGYKDQHLALRWIQENIAAFGGNASQVTIWGESAGGESVGAHLISYGGRDQGLFRGAIMQSSGPINPFRYNSPAEWDVYYNAITHAANCSTVTDTLACLRTVPSEALDSIFVSNITASIPSWGMEVDGDFIQQNAREALLSGRFIKVPVLQGQNHDEGTALTVRGINTDEQFLANVKSRGPDNATALEIGALYPDDPEIGIPPTLQGRPPASLGLQYKRISALVGDLVWHAPRRLTDQILARNNVSSWSYEFNVIPNGISPTMGATHFTEVAFVFYNLLGLGYPESPFEGTPQSYRDVANIISRYWVNFIVDGNPNSGEAGSHRWPSYSLSNPTIMAFDANTTDLAFPIPDTYRAGPIQYISDHLGSAFGR